METPPDNNTTAAIGSKENCSPTETDNDLSARGASIVKVEHSGASNTFTARSERYNRRSVHADQKRNTVNAISRTDM